MSVWAGYGEPLRRGRGRADYPQENWISEAPTPARRVRSSSDGSLWKSDEIAKACRMEGTGDDVIENF